MQQRQLRLGDILDDYCPRERRVTNHAVVAMIGDDVKQTRCTTCEAEHEYKHARIPRQRRKDGEPAALYAQVLAGGPKHVTHESVAASSEQAVADELVDITEVSPVPAGAGEPAASLEQSLNADEETGDGEPAREQEEGPVHRQLIRATLPRLQGQAPPTRPAPEFTIRQPAGGRPNAFRSRNQPRSGGQTFHGDRSNGASGGGPGRGGQRTSGGRSPNGGASRIAGRHDGNRKRSK